VALSASAREIRFALLWITRLERPGGQVRVASCLPEIVDIPGEIQHFLRRKIVPRHCCLQIRPAVPTKNAVRLVTIEVTDVSDCLKS